MKDYYAYVELTGFSGTGSHPSTEDDFLRTRRLDFRLRRKTEVQTPRELPPKPINPTGNAYEIISLGCERLFEGSSRSHSEIGPPCIGFTDYDAAVRMTRAQAVGRRWSGRTAGAGE